MSEVNPVLVSIFTRLDRVAVRFATESCVAFGTQLSSSQLQLSLRCDWCSLPLQGPFSEQKSDFLSDLRVGLVLGGQTSNPGPAVAGCPAQFSCLPAEIVAESQRSCFWCLPCRLGAGRLALPGGFQVGSVRLPV
ncbi:hypothetical protein P7K49_001730 [Saguinus oedipus]|uniref:Uncharacterized protein n=1 Tax=Saguinus oedipus TaxID=9490 RepID=A0ABQ9WFB1_SAGOE|nr:hypothetical protein P7K49_001730 [Saguinus oedipus]